MAINFSTWSHKWIDMDHAAVSVLLLSDFLPMTVNVKTNPGKTFLWGNRGSIWQPRYRGFLLFQFLTSERLCGYRFSAPPSLGQTCCYNCVSSGAIPSAFAVSKKNRKYCFFLSYTDLLPLHFVSCVTLKATIEMRSSQAAHPHSLCDYIRRDDSLDMKNTASKAIRWLFYFFKGGGLCNPHL